TTATRQPVVTKHELAGRRGSARLVSATAAAYARITRAGASAAGATEIPSAAGHRAVNGSGTGAEQWPGERRRQTESTDSAATETAGSAQRCAAAASFTGAEYPPAGNARLGRLCHPPEKRSPAGSHGSLNRRRTGP